MYRSSYILYTHFDIIMKIVEDRVYEALREDCAKLRLAVRKFNTER